MMRPEARQRMRDVLQEALRTAVLPGAAPDAPGGFRRTDLVASDLVDRFTRELTALGGSVHDTDGTAAAVVGVVRAILADVAGGSILTWDDQWIPVAGLSDALRTAGFILDHQGDDGLASPERRQQLASAVLGLTGADAALAETGSIVLASGPGRGRLASLLPPLHLAVVERRRVIGSLPELLLERPELATSGSNLVCITGPSRTADIEHILSRGVHGPREVHVVLV